MRDCVVWHGYRTRRSRSGFDDQPAGYRLALIRRDATREEHMATVYLMSLEDRVALARNQIDLAILRLRSIGEQSGSVEVEQFISRATHELKQIGELIGS